MKRISLAISLLLLLVPAVFGPVQARDTAPRQYLQPGEVDAEAVIQPPPAVGSAAFQEQMAVVLWLQRTRTPVQVEFVRKALDLERFAPLLDVALVNVDGIALKRVIETAIDEVRAEYDKLKGSFDLPRPFEVSHAVHPVAEPRAVAAYPSGHAIRAIVYARLLSEIFPDRKEALLDLARQIGYGRVLAGVHYPMDVLAGQKLGEAYADAIVDGSAFKHAIERVRGR